MAHGGPGGGPRKRVGHETSSEVHHLISLQVIRRFKFHVGLAGCIAAAHAMNLWVPCVFALCSTEPARHSPRDGGRLDEERGF